MNFDFEVLTSPAELTEFYNSVLVPSFPPGELVALQEFLDAAQREFIHVIAAVSQDGIIAGAVGTTPTQEGVIMLLYLALRPGLRGAGVGGKLIDHAVAQWKQLYNPTFILAEVEHPKYHLASPEHGDPAARLRFYARHGGQILNIPYFQPVIREDEPPVPALMLLTLWVAPEAFVAKDHVISWPLRASLRRELIETCAPDFVPALRVEESLAGEVVRLWDVTDLDQVPVGVFDQDPAL